MHIIDVARGFLLSLHVPVPLVNLALLQPNLGRQSSNLLLWPNWLNLELFEQKLVLVVVLTKPLLNFTVLLHRVIRRWFWVSKSLLMSSLASMTYNLLCLKTFLQIGFGLLFRQTLIRSYWIVIREIRIFNDFVLFSLILKFMRLAVN